MLTISSSWNTRIDFDTFTYHLNGVMTHRRHNTCTLPWRCQNQFQKIHDELPYLFNNSATSTQIQGRPTTHRWVITYKCELYVGCVFPMLIAKLPPERHTPLYDIFCRTNNSWFAFQVKECFHTRKCWNDYWFWVRANIQSSFFAQIIDMDGNVIIL